MVSQFFGITRHEFNMSFHRPGFWIAYALLCSFYIISRLMPSIDGSRDGIPPNQVWAEAGYLVFMFNIFMPLLAGILSADRLQRDFNTGVRELQRSTPLSIPAYILAKYLGVVASVLTPMFILVLAASILSITQGLAPISFLWPSLLAFLAIAVPAHAFVVAFSLACPLIMPLRIYQVLFTGYWFWGNLLSPTAFPTISDTILNAVGQYPLQAYFGIFTDSTHEVTTGFTRPTAVLNLLVLMACIAVALCAADRYLRWQARHA